MPRSAAFTPGDGNGRDDFAKIDRAASLHEITGANLCQAGNTRGLIDRHDLAGGIGVTKQAARARRTPT